MLTAIIQARTGSTRLPSKVLLDLCGKPVLWHVVERTRLAVPNVVVAYPHNGSGPISEMCRLYGWDHFEDCRSDEDDVLSRYYRCACRFGSDPIVRVTGDCPMIDPDVIEAVVREFESDRYDYVANNLDRTFPHGLDCEAFSFDALEEAYEDAPAEQREHVTEYLRETPGFAVGSVTTSVPGALLHRWTVDTTEDLDRVRAIVARLPEGYTWEDALRLSKPYY